MTQNREIVVECNDLSLTLVQNGDALRIVDRFNCRIRCGEFYALVGESGSGKTMIARALMRLMPASRLRIDGLLRFKNIDLINAAEPALRTLRGDRIGMIFQEPMTSLNPIMTVGEQVSETILAHRRVSRTHLRDRVEELFASVRLPKAGRTSSLYPHQLSGGMRQRVMIALALANDPDLLIADEPTTALDVTTQREILEIIKRRQVEMGLAVFYISHDLALVSRYADSVGVLYSGEHMEQGSAAHVIRSPAHPYTDALLRCSPGARSGSERKREIEGVVPRPHEQLPGCRFAPRCAYSSSDCVETKVEMRHVGAGLVRCLHPLL